MNQVGFSRRSIANQIQYNPNSEQLYYSGLHQQHYLNYPDHYRGINQIPLSKSTIDPRIYQTNPQLKQNIQNQTIQLSRLQTHNKQSNLEQSNGFHFGRQHAKIAKYVQDQLSKDQENRVILEKFRQDAINFRNNRRSHGVGKAVYTTQSMNPGPSNNPIVKNLQKISVPNRLSTQIINPNSHYIYRPAYPIYQPQLPIQPTIRYQTISLKRQFSKKDYKKKLKQKIKLQQLRQKSQEKWDELQKMIVKVNNQLKKNSRLITQNMKSHEKSSITPREVKILHNPQRKSIYYQTFNSEQTQQPTIQYSKSKTHINSQKQKIKDIKKHLDLLKRNKKRLQTLNQSHRF